MWASRDAEEGRVAHHRDLEKGRGSIRADAVHARADVSGGAPVKKEVAADAPARARVLPVANFRQGPRARGPGEVIALFPGPPAIAGPDLAEGGCQRDAAHALRPRTQLRPGHGLISARALAAEAGVEVSPFEERQDGPGVGAPVPVGQPLVLFEGKPKDPELTSTLRDRNQPAVATVKKPWRAGLELREARLEGNRVPLPGVGHWAAEGASGEGGATNRGWRSWRGTRTG
jgi:hypothetical protein